MSNSCTPTADGTCTPAVETIAELDPPVEISMMDNGDGTYTAQWDVPTSMVGDTWTMWVETSGGVRIGGT